MTSEVENKRHVAVKQQLKSGNTEIVDTALEYIRTHGESVLVPDIIELFHATNHAAIKNKALNLLNELKNDDCVPFLMQAIESKKYENDLQGLVSSCWLNGLNYKKYINVFVNLVIQKDFEVAFEAFTVIEHIMDSNKPDDLQAEITKLKKKMFDVDDKKKYLFVELIDMFKKVS